MRLGASLFAASFLLARAAMAGDLYVATTGNDGNDGSSANPFLTIQHGLDVAAAGDTVHVLAGTYDECVNSHGVAVTIHAEDTDPANTTIDATGLACGDLGAPGPTVWLWDGSKLEGFTVTGGGDSGVFGQGSVSITGNVITANNAVYGGGIYLLSDDGDSGTTATVVDLNVITDNTASYDGGGMFVSNYDADGVVREIQITNNVLQDNDVLGVDPQSGGRGGGVVLYSSSGTDGVAKITFTNNIVDGNTVTTNDPDGCTPSYGGGIWAVTFGLGNETIDLEDNQIFSNSSTGEGGGASLWITPDATGSNPAHTITFSGNTVSANDATAGGGGGLDLYMLAQDLPSTAAVTFTVADNEVAGNVSGGVCDPTVQVGGGGGMLVSYFSLRTDAPGITFDLHGNSLRSNGNDIEGGGAKLFSYADSDPDLGGVTGRATSTISFHHNLVTSNGTHDPVGNLSDSGGIEAGLQAYGDAAATVDVSFDTVSFNSVDSLGAAGIGIGAVTGSDTAGTADGVATVTIENSIVSGNLQGYGINALDPTGIADLTVNVAYSDVFGNASGEYGPVVGDRNGTNGNISADPLLSASFLPDVCSPTVDAADPAADWSEEPAPNGQRANMGHFGGTPDAAATLPDINGDNVVDGVDLLAIATSFASDTSRAWYSAAADIDKEPDPVSQLLDVDGDDLAFVAAYYGRVCP